MADKHLKVIQDGRVSFIPDTPFNRAFWAKQNAKVSGSRNAQHEMVTILPASANEEAELNVVSVSQPKASSQESEFETLRKQLADQQALINKLLLKEDKKDGEGEKEKSKPGPKPKTEQ